MVSKATTIRLVDLGVSLRNSDNSLKSAHHQLHQQNIICNFDATVVEKTNAPNKIHPEEHPSDKF